jgi:hypothetical protein
MGVDAGILLEGAAVQPGCNRLQREAVETLSCRLGITNDAPMVQQCPAVKSSHHQALPQLSLFHVVPAVP